MEGLASRICLIGMLLSTVKEIILSYSPWPSVLGAYGKMEF